MSKKQFWLIIVVLLLIVILLGVYQYTNVFEGVKKKETPKDSFVPVNIFSIDKEEQENAKKEQEVSKKIEEGANPYEEIEEKANPFKSSYENPFE